jgi:hypothetical protein
VNLTLAGQRVSVTDQDLLGEGGEARVYRFKDLALKVFHTADPVKLDKLAAFPRALPKHVIAPLELLQDARGKAVGYAMRRLDGAEEASRLLVRRWREGAVPNAALLQLFSHLGLLLEAVHQSGVVVGDLNDGNVLFKGSEPFLIDADSMQFGAWPCPVAHERYLDPALYGVDLSKAPRFSKETDWYAFAVMLFHALTYVHPFGGVHPTLPTMLRRAEKRHSVLRQDVAFPKSGVHYRVLPDAALDWFQRVFEKDLREKAPAAVLGLQWTKCSCGLEHARASCPDCKALGPAAAVQATRYVGRCKARSIFQTRGRILAAAMQGGVRYAYEEDGVVRREDGQEVLARPAAAGTEVALAGPWTFVAEPSGAVLGVRGGRIEERAQTEVRGTQPVLAASSSSLYRLEGSWLIEQHSGARVGQILSARTWLWAGERFGLGFYRVGDGKVLFTFQAGQSGLRQVHLDDAAKVTLTGRLVDADCVFDEQHALLSLVTEREGQTRGGLYLFDAKARLVARAEGQGGRLFSTARGRAVLNGRVVACTDEGLLALGNDAGVLVERTLFSDTREFVGANDVLLPQPDGSLVVVGPKEITQLSLS